jgi:hypothetical protein
MTASSVWSPCNQSDTSPGVTSARTRGESTNENFNIRSEITRAAVKIQAHYRGGALHVEFI